MSPETDPHRPVDCFLEEERGPEGQILHGAVVLLTSRRCPWRCLYCDLGAHTTSRPVPVGAIPAQLDHALEKLGAGGRVPAEQIKLYNHGSFFDRGAVPPQDHSAIARRVRSLARVIVESHPALIGDPVLRFRDQLAGRLEVAMGLETANADVLARLNRRMTLDQFARAVDFLNTHRIDVRAFILVQPPFQAASQAADWAVRSVESAFGCGVSVAVLIPTRGGTATLNRLAARGEFLPPRLATIESALEESIRMRRGRVFVDTWDLERFVECPRCGPARVRRVQDMNRFQELQPPVPCPCRGKSPA